MPTITQILPLLQSALATIAMFNGTAKAAQDVAYVQDAVMVVSALTPLVLAFGSGQEVTPEQVRLALKGKDDALATFDQLIAAKEAEQAGKK
jgi:hypothetical protein